MAKNFHERYPTAEHALPSDRSCGVVFAVVAVVVAYLWRSHSVVATAALLIAAVLLIVSFFAPSTLRPLNIVWFRFGLLLNKVVSPVVMFILFVVAIVPFGLAMQLVRDPLRKRRSAANTYWILRSEDAARSDMSNQF
jgi:predicted membrane metal-binding protein